MTDVLISNLLGLQAQNRFATNKIEFESVSVAMTTRHPLRRFAPTAIRMRALRRSSAYPDRQDFADFIGVTLNTLSNIENGYSISRGVAAQIVEKMPWISEDWLQRGNERFLTGATLQILLPLIAEESDTTVRRSRAPSRAGAARS